MEKGKLKILVNILLVLLIGTFGFYLIKTIIDCISIANDMTTSFPWYTAIVMNSLIFIIPIVLELVLFIYFYIRSRR